MTEQGRIYMDQELQRIQRANDVKRVRRASGQTADAYAAASGGRKSWPPSCTITAYKPAPPNISVSRCVFTWRTAW